MNDKVTPMATPSTSTPAKDMPADTKAAQAGKDEDTGTKTESGAAPADKR